MKRSYGLRPKTSWSKFGTLYVNTYVYLQKLSHNSFLSVWCNPLTNKNRKRRRRKIPSNKHSTTLICLLLSTIFVSITISSRQCIVLTHEDGVSIMLDKIYSSLSTKDGQVSQPFCEINDDQEICEKTLLLWQNRAKESPKKSDIAKCKCKTKLLSVTLLLWIIDRVRDRSI